MKKLKQLNPSKTLSLFLMLFIALIILLINSDMGYSSESTPSHHRFVSENHQLNRAQLADASQLMGQATLGANYQQIVNAASLGREKWIEQQFNQPIGWHLPALEAIFEKYDAHNEKVTEESEDFVSPDLMARYAWWQLAMEHPDPLRQRIAYALSQIFVVSDQAEILLDIPESTIIYYDLLLEHAFGNFRDLLQDITYSPTMGLYLSHFNNSKGQPEKSIYPDENFAREVMQLFTIGLYELNQDGTQKKDKNNQPIATYSNAQITEFAKIFTGLGNGCGEQQFGSEEVEVGCPMTMYEQQHSPGPKKLLNGVTVPAGLSGDEEIQIALDNLFNHPNVGPFIARLLIQRLTTSNPSAAYIHRVAGAFNNNGRDERGDMKAVIKAILLDPEVIKPEKSIRFGKLREPFLRFTQLFRAVNSYSETQEYYLEDEIQEMVKQFPLSAPSVFNFYSPNYRPHGELSRYNLVAPEFQISTSTTIVAYYNLAQWLILNDEPLATAFNSGPVHMDFEELKQRTGIAEKLDFLNLVLTGDSLSQKSLKMMQEFLAYFDDPEDQARIATYLVFTSPEFIAQF